MTDLRATVSGVVRGSPAWEAGVRRGDVFELINGARPRCRVEAWNLLLPAGEVRAEVQRGGRRQRVSWRNRREGESGITMEYDFDPSRAEKLAEVVRSCPGRSLLLTSALGHTVVREIMSLRGIGSDEAEGAVHVTWLEQVVGVPVVLLVIDSAHEVSPRGRV